MNKENHAGERQYPPIPGYGKGFTMNSNPYPQYLNQNSNMNVNHPGMFGNMDMLEATAGQCHIQDQIQMPVNYFFNNFGNAQVSFYIYLSLFSLILPSLVLTTLDPPLPYPFLPTTTHSPPLSLESVLLEPNLKKHSY